MTGMNLKTVTQVECEEDEKLSFMSMPIWKLVLLLVLTFGLYSYVWFFKYWEQIKKNYNLSIRTVIRTFFIFFTCYSLFSVINKHFKKYGYEINSALCTVLYMTGICLESQRGLIGIMFTVVAMSPIVMIQCKINKLNEAHIQNAEQNNWTWLTTLGLIIFYVFIVLICMLYMILLPES